MNTIHDFNESKERSHKWANATWWYEVYRKAFPGMLACVNTRDDGWWQRSGIDRVITLKTSRVITVDEKVREKDWPDIALERWSDEARREPGWIQKPLACEFIAYAFVPSATCYLFPTLTLQRAWRLHGRDWCVRHQEVRALNKGYTTVSVAVPKQELLDSIKDALLVTWEPQPEPDDFFDAEDDIRKSVEEGFRVIRNRKANGGSGWGEDE